MYRDFGDGWIPVQVFYTASDAAERGTDQDERDRVHAIALEHDRRIASWARTGLGRATSTTPASAGEPKAQTEDLRGVDRG